MFSATGQLGKEQQLLVDRGNARGLRRLRRGEGDGLAVQQHRAGIRLVHARHDFDQRRLAGTVLAEERMHLAGAHVEADAGERPHAGEGLLDVRKLQDGGHEAGPSPGS
jgi:hypothetical protein